MEFDKSAMLLFFEKKNVKEVENHLNECKSRSILENISHISSIDANSNGESGN